MWFAVILILFFSPLARADSWGDIPAPAVPPPIANSVPETLLGPAPPYTPRKTDYSFEFGMMRAAEDSFWLGADIGYHVGRCVLSDSQTCQQYFDIIGGAGVREAESYGMVLGSLRWQYVNFPDRASPFWRLFAGPSFVNRAADKGWKFDGGAGVGVTTFLHEKVDLRVEGRVGYIDHVYAQAVIGVQIKADRLLTYFARKLKDLGYGTYETAVDAAGAVIDATGEGVHGIVKGVGSQMTPDKRPGEKPKEKSETPKSERQ